MEEVRFQDSSFFTGKELKASLNAKGKAESDVVRRRNIRAAKRAPYNLKAGARKCNSSVDGVKQRPSKDPKKSNATATIAPKQAPRLQSSYNILPDILTNKGIYDLANVPFIVID